MVDAKLTRENEVVVWGTVKKEFGFVAKTDFEAGLKKTIDWYTTNRTMS